MKYVPLSIAVIVLLVMVTRACAASPIIVVAAENFYGDIAQQIGGANVKVTSILNNPDEDPHLFEASPSVARALSTAWIVIENGIDYDPWMQKLLDASPHAGRIRIVVADLMGQKAGDNPHVWYDPRSALLLAHALMENYSSIDPAHKDDYKNRFMTFEQSLQPIHEKVVDLHDRFAGTPVTATEPVFGYMFDALAMIVRNKSFQLAVMNDTEPSASDVVAFENDLKTHKVKLLIYNGQASDPTADRMKKLAEASHIPVIAVTETEPPQVTYQAWLSHELDAVEKALRTP